LIEASEASLEELLLPVETILQSIAPRLDDLTVASLAWTSRYFRKAVLKSNESSVEKLSSKIPSWRVEDLVELAVREDNWPLISYFLDGLPFLSLFFPSISPNALFFDYFLLR